MAISYVASATSDYTATTPAAQAVPMPAGWQEGDLLLLFIPQGVATNSTTVTWTGATEVGNSLGGSDQFTSLWWKIASASESPTYSTSDASSRSSSVMVAYRGVDPSTPIDVAVGFVDSPAGTSHTVPSQTVTAGAWLVSLASLDGSAGTATPQYTEPSGWTKRLDYLNNTTDNYASGLADLGPLSAGTQSGHVWTSVYADRAVNVTVVALRNYVPPSVNGYILMESGDRVLSESGADLVVSEDYAPSASGSGSLSLSGAGSASGEAVASGVLALSGTAAAGGTLSAAAGSLTLTGTGSAGGEGAAVGTGALSLSGTASATGGTPASGALTLSGAAGASAALTATGSLSLSGTASASGGGTSALYIGATSVAQTGTAGTSSPSAAMPSGTQGGDLLVAFHGIGSSSDTVTFPAGWSTPVRETGATGVGDSFSWKIAAGTVGQATTEPALVVTSGTNRNHVVVLLAFRVSDTSNPIVVAAHSPITPASTTKATPGGTASGDILELNAVFDHPAGSTSSDSTWTVPSGLTVRGETNNVQNGSFGSSVVVATNNTNPTSTGSMPSRTWTTTLNVVGSAWSVALKSGGSPSAPTPTIAYRVNGLARVRTKTTNATSVRLKIGTDSGVTTGIQYTSAVTPDAEGLALHDWTGLGLTAGQRYYYRVMMTDSLSAEIADSESTVGTFKVAPSGQSSFNFCFAGCTQEGPDSAALAAVAARGDDFFLHLGDMYYADGSGTSLANFRAKMDEKLSVANHKAVFATMGMSYCSSDHDGGMNNNYVGAGDATARDNFNAAHRERFPNPLVPSTTGTYHTWVWGRVRFIHTDERSFKSLAADTDNSSKTMLGATQKQWFKDTITATTAEQVIVWVGDTPWTGATTAGEDHWAGYNTERQELATFITASGKNVARLGSDMHAVAADDGTNSAGGIPVFHGGPLNNNASIKGVYTHGPYPASGTAVVQQYGRIVVTDSDTSISLAFTGYSSDNTARVTYTKTFTTSPTSATGTGSLTLSGTAGASAGAPAAGSLSLSGTASARGAAVASGSLSLSGSGGAQATAAAAGSLTLTGTGTAAGFGEASGAGTLTLSGAASASGVAVATGSLALSGSAAAGGAATGAGSLSLSGAASATGAASASGALSLSGTATGSGSAPASATGFITLYAETVPALPGGAPAAGSISISGTAGARGVASATGSVSLSGTGSAFTQTSGTGSIALSGSANILTTPTAGGVLSLSGTSTSSQGGSPASGTLSLSGAAGASAPLWVVTGNLSLSGAASARAAATAAGSLSLVGNASTTGSFPATGTGDLSLGGTAAAGGGVSATGTLSVSGGASVPATPTGSGTLLISGTASGLTGGNVAPGSITLTGTAGARAAAGANGTLTMSGSAGVGTITPASGTGSLSLSGTASASGRASSATGSLAVSGSASTQATVLPVGTLSLSGTAGARGTLPSATGALSLSGASAVSVVATASGSIELNGYVILVPAPVLVNPVARLRPNTARANIRPNGRGSLKRNTARGRIRT